MKLTAKLAKSQLEVNRRRTGWTLIGIILSVAMLTAVYGFALGGRDLLTNLTFETWEIVALEADEYGIQAEAELVERYIYQSTRFTRVFIIISAVLSAVIVGISVVIVSNAFRISAAERLRQFGILKSVGATRRQIRQTVIYESIFLAIFGIPIGLIVGFLVQGIGIQIANYFLETIVIHNTETLNFVISWEIILAAVVVSIFTAILAAWLPARKAAKVPAIDAIRGAGEIKVKAKHSRSGRVVGKIFGFEGALAAKSQKRNRRSVRATVIALTISIILFIAAAGFGETIDRASLVFMGDVTDHIVAAGFTANWHDRDTNLTNEKADEITQRLQNFGDVDLIGVGSDRFTYLASLQRENLTPAMVDFLYDVWHTEADTSHYILPVSLVTTDPETFEMLARRAGVAEGSNILINHITSRFMHFDDTGRLTETRWVDFVPFAFIPPTIEFTDNEEYVHQLDIQGVLTRDELPIEVWDAASGHNGISILVPELSTEMYAWYATPADDINMFVEYARSVLHEVVDIPVREIGDHAPGIRLQVINILQETMMVTNTYRLVMVFIYGFVALLIVIGLTNIISTISTNIQARSREFAMLSSVGMDVRGLHRMLNFENIFCSAKALIIGLPLGVLASWLIHETVADGGIMFAYEVPWMAVLYCVIGVFVITWLVTRVSAGKLRGQNIVETIRMESGM
ncbi:MAG: ABC transporter permease [Oscillospiraceae bacterium]|nr:ABC transporter permease [Oscillospiraceae bacterium]